MIDLDYHDMSDHVGHQITVGVVFGANEEPSGLSLDCHTCGDTLAVEDKPETHEQLLGEGR